MRSNNRITTAVVSALTAILTLCPPQLAAAAEREQAEQAYLQQRYQDAITLLRQITRAQPRDATAWLRLGNALEHTADDTQALVAYQTAAQIGLPAEREFGYLEARQVRGKALLNMARLGLRDVRLALDEYARSGALHRQFGEMSQQLWREERRLKSVGDDVVQADQ